MGPEPWLLELEKARDSIRKGESYPREKEVLMSEGLSCCNSADLPLRAVDDWLALWPGCMDNDCLSESFKTCLKAIFTLEGLFEHIWITLHFF